MVNNVILMVAFRPVVCCRNRGYWFGPVNQTITLSPESKSVDHTEPEQLHSPSTFTTNFNFLLSKMDEQAHLGERKQVEYEPSTFDELSPLRSPRPNS